MAVSADLLQAVNQPATIESIEVFGAGHNYDAFISNVRLLVDRRVSPGNPKAAFYYRR